MRKFIIATALVLATAPAFATGVEIGSTLGTTEEAVRVALTEMGWDVRKLDTEDGMIEAYAVMGAEMAEIYVDPASGEIVKISAND